MTMTLDARAGLDPALVRLLRLASPRGVELDVPLSRLSRWRIGGTAHAVVEPSSSEEVAAVVAAMKGRPEPLRVVGDTSNLLFDSAGFDGVLVRIGRRMSRFSIDGDRVWTQAGTSVPTLSRAVGARGLTGIEHAIGIPGTVGGLVLMNGGSQRKGIGSNVETVTVVGADAAQRTLTASECAFAYRSSALQHSDDIVVDVTLTLAHDDPDRVRATMRDIMLDRMGKFPSQQPNCGSTFLSHPDMYATVGPPGRIIEEMGLKGTSRGGAQISHRHANFIVNSGGATSDDVLWLIALIRTAVEERTGFRMDCEARFLSHSGDLVPAHAAAAQRWGDAVRAG